MIGRDFTHVGTSSGTYSQYGDGYGFPFKGEIKPVFIDNSTVAVMDQDKGIHVQRLGGQSYYICPPPTAEEIEAAKGEDSESDEDSSVASSIQAVEDIRYKEIIPVAICALPQMSTHVAVADINNFIKICNKAEWSTDSLLGGVGSAVGKFARISAIASFMCENEILYVVAELGNQRIQIVDEVGSPVVSIAGTGILPGQFRDPVAVAVYMDTSNVRQRTRTAGETALESLTLPTTPMGGGRMSGFGRSSADTTGVARLSINTGGGGGNSFTRVSPSASRSHAVMELAGSTSSGSSPTAGATPPSPGAMFRQSSGVRRIAGRRTTAVAPVGFGDIKPHWFHGICKLRDLKSRIGRKMEVGRYALGKRHDDHLLYDFLYIVQPHADAQPAFEHVVFRVRDSDGRIFNCTDELNNCADPNGYGCLWEAITTRYSKHLRHDTDPRPFASIAVADVGNKRVQIFKYYFTIIPDLYAPALEFCTLVGGAKSRTLALSEPSGVAYTPTGGELIICDAGIKKLVILSKRLDIIAVISIGFELAKNNFRTSTPGSRPGTRGGRGSRPGTRSGRLELGRTASVKKGATHDYKACAVSVSDDGKIAVGFKCGGLLVYHPFKSFQLGILEMLTVPLFLRVLEYCTYSDAVALRDCCKYLHDFTKERRSLWALAGMRVDYCQRAVYSYIKWAKTVEGLPGLSYSVPCTDINGVQVCTRFLELKCVNPHCTKPHTMPVYDYKYLARAKENALDLVSFYGIICFVFSSTFLWKNEVYLKELFEFYCVVRKTCVRVDPMTRKNEVIRDQHYERIKAINFSPFLVIMTLLEEDYCGLKPLTQHPLFKNRIVAKQQTALMAAIRELQPEVIDEVVLYHDPYLEKYAPVINIPANANKTTRFRCLPSMETDRTNGQGQTATEHHIQTFELVGDRAGSLLNKLFS